MSKATGASLQTSCNDLNPGVLGVRQVRGAPGGRRALQLFSECDKLTACTIILRGGAEQASRRPPAAPRPAPSLHPTSRRRHPLSSLLPSQFIAEAERSLHDAIMNTRRLLVNPSVIAGGGAIEMELSKHLRDHSRKIYGKQQLLIAAYAKALEVIPRQVSANAGMDPTDVLNKLRMKHAHGGKWYGRGDRERHLRHDGVVRVGGDHHERNALAAATEAACLILSVDETVRNPASEQPDAKNYPGGRGMGGMMAAAAGAGAAAAAGSAR